VSAGQIKDAADQRNAHGHVQQFDQHYDDSNNHQLQRPDLVVQSVASLGAELVDIPDYLGCHV
jgi:hypothetical protein